MITFIFVYTSSKFRATGLEPIKRIELDPRLRVPYESAAPVIAPGQEGVLARGVYATHADADDAPDVEPVDAVAGLDHDVFRIKRKDPWPRLIDPDTSVAALPDTPVALRIRAAFPGLRDVDLQVFAPAARSVAV